jgi:uncharacterized protein
MDGEVGHFEIPADNLARARKFYAETFGWTMMDFPGLEYTMVRTGAVDEKGMPTGAGYIGGGIGKRDRLLEHPVVTILVEEISDAEKAIAKNGGKVIRVKQPIGDGSMGFTAYFKDSEGNTIGLYQAPKR